MIYTDNMRISRKDKKKLRSIFLCYTGNPGCRSSKYSKETWILLKKDFIIWLGCISMEDRKNANNV